MKKKLYYLISLCFIFFSSCEKENSEIDQLNIEYKDTFNEKRNGQPTSGGCTIGYIFSGDIGVDVSGQNNFLFTWDFSNALVACNIELAIEFRTTTTMPCPGYFPPGGQTSSHYQNFPISINNNGIASVYFNPISDNMIANKTFEFRTIITGTSCGNQNIQCETIGDWQGPLCSYMF